MLSKLANIKISSAFAQKSLSAHSIIGLSAGVLLYLVCLTGTLTVLEEEFERWEQPNTDEFIDYNVRTIESSIDAYLEKTEKLPNSLYVVFPTDELPRMHVSAEGKEWYVNRDGSLGLPPPDAWTHMLKDLHVHLHLPHTPGLVIVSISGVMLLALSLSGLIAHPRIFIDAFRLRLGGTLRVEQADIHNRLAVWGLPFNLMIGITGALFGLISLFAFVAAAAFYDGDTNKLTRDVYGSDPEIKNAPKELNIAQALDSLEKVSPDANPIYLVAHNMGSDKQYMEIAATLPGRLIYSEIYRFEANGNFIDQQGFANGPNGQQAIYSIYRLHFGRFGGTWLKLAYVLMGLALTIVCVSGINTWLARRGGRDALHDAWCATVWGLPLALSFSALISLLFSTANIFIFLAAWTSAYIFSLARKEENKSRQILKSALSATLILLVGVYSIRYTNQLNEPHIASINMGLIAIALYMLGEFVKPTLSFLFSQKEEKR